MGSPPRTRSKWSRTFWSAPMNVATSFGTSHRQSLSAHHRLAFPFVSLQGKFRQTLLLTNVSTGLFVQLLALSSENQRFFFERGFEDFFFVDDPWVYFKHSALFARVAETISLHNGPPSSAHFFNSIPVRRWSTYCILGPGNLSRTLAPEWMRSFKIYYLPRPWPLWMSTINPVLCPINVSGWLMGLLVLWLTGVGFIYFGVRADRAHALVQSNDSQFRFRILWRAGTRDSTDFLLKD